MVNGAVMPVGIGVELVCEPAATPLTKMVKVFALRVTAKSYHWFRLGVKGVWSINWLMPLVLLMWKFRSPPPSAKNHLFCEPPPLSSPMKTSPGLPTVEDGTVLKFTQRLTVKSFVP